MDDFCSDNNNGISLLLDILRNSLNQQQCPGMVFSAPKRESSPQSALHSNSKGKEMNIRSKQLLLKKAMVSNLYSRGSYLQSFVTMLFVYILCLERVFAILCDRFSSRKTTTFTRVFASLYPVDKFK